MENRSFGFKTDPALQMTMIGALIQTNQCPPPPSPVYKQKLKCISS